MKAELNPCYILHNRNYRETSLLLDVFSRQYGRVSLVAKGGRTQKNARRALLQPGRKINAAWSMRRELGTLTGAEPCQGHTLQASGSLLSVFYINELLVRLLHRDEPHAELFDTYEMTLHKLNDGTHEQLALRIFEKRLLEALGYGLVLDADAEGNAIRPEQDYNYLPEQGAVPADTFGADGLNISGRALLGLAHEALDDEVMLGEAKQLMRRALGRLLGDKPLRSRELYQFNRGSKVSNE